MLYAGLDCHLRTSCLCILDEDGKVVKQQTGHGRAEAVVEELAKLGQERGQPVEVVFGAGGGYGPLYEEPAGVARRVVWAHPAGLGLIWKSKRKNDRVDAQKPAKPLYLDAVPAAHVPGAATRRRRRRLIELRRSLVRRRAGGAEEPGARAAADQRRRGAGRGGAVLRQGDRLTGRAAPGRGVGPGTGGADRADARQVMAAMLRDGRPWRERDAACGRVDGNEAGTQRVR
jgi:hypothetical protein